MGSPRKIRYEFGSFVLDPVERLLTRDAVRVPLPPRAFDTLVTLVRNSGRLVEKDELLNAIWGETIVEEVNLSVQISSLRRALGDSQQTPKFIETVPKKGYRFIADVCEVNGAGLASGNGEEVPAETSNQNSIPAERDAAPITGPRRFYSNPYVITAVILAVVATAIVILINRKSSTGKAHTAPPSFNNYSWQRLSTDGNSRMAQLAPNGEFVVYVDDQPSSSSLMLRRIKSSETLTLIPKLTAPIWGLA